MKVGALLSKSEGLTTQQPAFCSLLSVDGASSILPCKVDVFFFDLTFGQSPFGDSTVWVQRQTLQQQNPLSGSNIWHTQNFCFELYD